MGNTVFFDLYAGCSGDMILGALLDCGLPLEDLQNELNKVPLSGFSIEAEKVKRGAMAATLARVVVDVSIQQPERSHKDIVGLIARSRLGDSVRTTAQRIFSGLAEAEARVHGTSPDHVHFHEVGAVDSIVDIIGAAIGFDLLDIVNFYSSPFPLAGGSVQCRHGALPLPAPAVLELVAARRAPVEQPAHAAMDGQELVTPTGAAIVTALAEFRRPAFNLARVGCGAGGRNPEAYPNILRLWLGTSCGPDITSAMVLLETNIDDMNPQFYDYVMERLFREGALDVWFSPIQMKKNRPAIMLSVLAPGNAESRLAEILLRETSTLGIRVRPVFRHIAGRESVELDSSYGIVNVKVKRLHNEILSISPEYDECRKIAAERGIPLRDVYRVLEAEARQKLAG